MHFAQIRQGEGVGAAGGTQHQHLGAAPGKGLRLLLSGAGGAADGVVYHESGDALPEDGGDLFEEGFRKGGLGHQAAGVASFHLLRVLSGLQNDGPLPRPAGGADDLGMGPLPGDEHGDARPSRLLHDGVDAGHEGTGSIHGADIP